MTSSSVGRQRPRAFDGGTTAEIAIFDATEALLHENSLQDITVAMILKQAGLSRANFYHYFANKFDVVAALVRRLVDDVYSDAAPWRSDPGKQRARSMGTSLQKTLDLWTAHGDVICAVVEHMHSVPAIARAWETNFDLFVDSVAEQIEFARSAGTAPAGPPAVTVATMLVCGVERTFYVGSRGLDQRLTSPDDAVESLVALNFSAIYGFQHSSRRTPKSGPAADLTPPVGEGRNSSAEPPTSTAEAILTATNELLISESLDELSVAKILERANASRATFYFYFANKDEAFIALFRTAASKVVEGMERLVSFDRNELGQINGMVTEWLDLDEPTMAVIRNAVHEWPRRPELRTVYLATMDRMADLLQHMIESDRATGLAVPGPPAREYASTLLWTIERTVAGALAQEKNLEDFDLVKQLLGQALAAAVYGRES